MRLLLTVVVLTLSGGAVGAQPTVAPASAKAYFDGTAQDHLAGKWAVTGAAAQGSTEAGGTWSRREVTGTLELTQDGSAVTGNWSGGQDPSWSVTGRVQSGAFELRTETRQVQVTIDGAPTTIAMRWTFRGAADKDTLTGTMALHRVDEPPTFAQPLIGRRK